MQIDEGTYKRLPAHLQALFERLPNPSSDDVLALFPATGVSRGGNSINVNGWVTSRGTPNGIDPGYGDSGSAARFFYCAKASKRDRDEGLEDMPEVVKQNAMRSANGTGEKNFEGGFPDVLRRNPHPTVKPTALMRYLVRLVTPPGGTVLDPFMGSGSTGKAAALEGFSFVGIDKEPEYVEIARLRIAKAQEQPSLFE